MHGNMKMDIITLEPRSVRIIVLSGIQLEPIQLPVCIKLGSSMHIEVLVSLVEQRTHLYTGTSRRLPECAVAI